jgi:hypothetical protein
MSNWTDFETQRKNREETKQEQIRKSHRLAPRVWRLILQMWEVYIRIEIAVQDSLDKVLTRQTFSVITFRLSEAEQWETLQLLDWLLVTEIYNKPQLVKQATLIDRCGIVELTFILATYVRES